MKAPVVPDRIPIAAESELHFELSQLAAGLDQPETENTWILIDAAVRRFQSAVRGGACSFPEEVVRGLRDKETVKGLCRCAITERSAISASTLALFSSLATRLGSSFSALLPAYLPSLLRLLSRPNKVYVARAKETLGVIVKKCGPSAGIWTLVRIAAAEWKGDATLAKSNTFRQGVIETVLLLLSRHGEPDAASVERRKEIISEVEWFVKTAATDRDASVRGMGKEMWGIYGEIWNGRVAAFVAPLTPTTRKYLSAPAAAASVVPAKRPAPSGHQKAASVSVPLASTSRAPPPAPAAEHAAPAPKPRPQSAMDHRRPNAPPPAAKSAAVAANLSRSVGPSSAAAPLPSTSSRQDTKAPKQIFDLTTGRMVPTATPRSRSPTVTRPPSARSSPVHSRTHSRSDSRGVDAHADRPKDAGLATSQSRRALAPAAASVAAPVDPQGARRGGFKPSAGRPAGGLGRAAMPSAVEGTAPRRAGRVLNSVAAQQPAAAAADVVKSVEAEVEAPATVAHPPVQAEPAAMEAAVAVPDEQVVVEAAPSRTEVSPVQAEEVEQASVAPAAAEPQPEVTSEPAVEEEPAAAPEEVATVTAPQAPTVASPAPAPTPVQVPRAQVVAPLHPPPAPTPAPVVLAAVPLPAAPTPQTAARPAPAPYVAPIAAPIAHHPIPKPQAPAQAPVKPLAFAPVPKSHAAAPRPVAPPKVVAPAAKPAAALQPKSHTSNRSVLSFAAPTQASVLKAEAAAAVKKAAAASSSTAAAKGTKFRPTKRPHLVGAHPTLSLAARMAPQQPIQVMRVEVEKAAAVPLPRSPLPSPTKKSPVQEAPSFLLKEQERLKQSENRLVNIPVEEIHIEESPQRKVIEEVVVLPAAAEQTIVPVQAEMEDIHEAVPAAEDVHEAEQAAIALEAAVAVPLPASPPQELMMEETETEDSFKFEPAAEQALEDAERSVVEDFRFVPASSSPAATPRAYAVLRSASATPVVILQTIQPVTVIVAAQLPLPASPPRSIRSIEPASAKNVFQHVSPIKPSSSTAMMPDMSLSSPYLLKMASNRGLARRPLMLGVQQEEEEDDEDEDRLLAEESYCVPLNDVSSGGDTIIFPQGGAAGRIFALGGGGGANESAERSETSSEGGVDCFADTIRILPSPTPSV